MKKQGWKQINQLGSGMQREGLHPNVRELNRAEVVIERCCPEDKETFTLDQINSYLSKNDLPMTL